MPSGEWYQTLQKRVLPSSLRVIGPFFVDSLPLKMVATHCSETSGTAYLMARCHIPEDLNIQQHCCENLTYRSVRTLHQHF
jgi:hypothetical protein